MTVDQQQVSPREAQRVLTAELLAALRHQAQASTEFMERLGGQIVNNILEQWSGTFDATGIITRDYGVAAGTVTVNNLGAAGHIITVSSSGQGGSAAPSGTGTGLVDGGTERTVPLGSRTMTLYGTNGDRVSFYVTTRAITPSST